MKTHIGEQHLGDSQSRDDEFSRRYNLLRRANRAMTSYMRKCMKVSGSKEDRISDLPNAIIDHILDYMPLRDAARTNVDQWMFFLSRNGVRELSLLSSRPTGVPYQLPSCVFSCASLEHLTLNNVVIKPRSCLFLRNLVSLSFKSVKFVPSSPSGFSCSLTTPQLKKLSIESGIGFISFEIITSLLEVYMVSSSAVASFIKQNLKEFKFSLGVEARKLHQFHRRLSSWLLPKLSTIRILFFDGFFLQLLALGITQIELPQAGMCVEHLTLDNLNFTDLDQISSAVCLLQSSPNLRILDLNVSAGHALGSYDLGIYAYFLVEIFIHRFHQESKLTKEIMRF